MTGLQWAIVLAVTMALDAYTTHRALRSNPRAYERNVLLRRYHLPVKALLFGVVAWALRPWYDMQPPVSVAITCAFVAVVTLRIAWNNWKLGK